MSILSRPENLANYIINTRSTIRKTAIHFELSKSTVHIDVSKKLKAINMGLYRQVKEILDFNFDQRNIRGGEATKQKYLKLRNKVG
ncbi:MAG TPA: stage III sporulation protein D [Clostridiales bacterium]|nr:stage III sporulation protein D [Clostridiales bacterium]